MASEDAKNGVERLIELSSKLTARQDYQGAVQTLRQALTIAPENERILAALDALSPKDGSDLVQNSDERDVVVPTQGNIASRFPEDAQETFEELWNSGEQAIQSLVDALLNPKIWRSEDERIKAELDAFSFLLGKLLEPSHFNESRTMRAIARLLAVDAKKVAKLIDAKMFSAIASCLHIKNSSSLRTQATLAIAKFLETVPERGQDLLTTFVITRMSGYDYDNLIVALSAASAMFPFVRKAAVDLFLTNRFCDNLIVVSDRSSNPNVTYAVLELLSAACIEKPCREAISKSTKCMSWIQARMKTSKCRKQDRVLAAVILSKTLQENPQQVPQNLDLARFFKELIREPFEETVTPVAVEGLMFESVSSKVKEDLANDDQTLKSLIRILSNTKVPFLYAGMTIFQNLTRYPEQLSQEGQRLAQLKSYANANGSGTGNPGAESDPLEDDIHVTARCQKVLDAGVVSVLVSHYKQHSPAVLISITSTALAISKHPKHRGKMVQQGCLKMALELSNVQGGTEELETVKLQASLILAHILIPIDPNLIFSGNNARAIPQAIRPLVHLLTTPYLTPSGATDLRPQMEALRALTNLATVDPSSDSSAQESIFTSCWPLVPEDLTTHHHEAIRRAAVQLVCNMAAHPGVQAWFGERSARAGTRIRQLLALTQAEDSETSLAAGGAVAGLTVDKSVGKNLVEWTRGVPIVLDMLTTDADMQARGLAVVANLSLVEETKKALQSGGASEALSDLLREAKSGEPALIDGATALLKELDGS